MMQLEVAGQQFINFISLSMARQIDQLAGTFNFRATSDDESLFPIKAGQPAKVTIGGIPILTGHVEEVFVDYSAAGHTITATGRDITGDIVDSTAQIKVFTGALTLQQIARQLLAEGKINIKVKTDPEGLEILPFKEGDKEEAETGQTIMSFLEPYCRKRQVLQSTDGEGNFVFTQAGQTRAVRGLINVRGGTLNNVLAGGIRVATNSRFNGYQVQSIQNPTVIKAKVSNFEIANNRGVATDPEIRESRFLEISMESSGDTDDATARAKWEVNVRRARAKTYTATVQGFFQDREETRLWKINERVNVQDEFCDVNAALLVTGIEYRLDTGDGSTTTLTLQAPDSYTIETESAAEAKGAVFGDAFQETVPDGTSI